MKKIILSCIVAVLMITSLVLFISARNEDNYTYVIQFHETEKAYPIMNSEADAIGFLSYYQSNLIHLSYNNFITGVESTLQISITYNGIVITNGNINGNYPPIFYQLTPDMYDDVGIIYKQGNYYIVVWENGEVRIEESWSNINEYGGSFDYSTPKSEISDGYYVQFPATPEPPPSQSYTTPIAESIIEFVKGIGASFLGAFTAIFIVDGQLNSLAIFVLCIFGLTLGYGIIRWITGLFRKESN